MADSYENTYSKAFKGKTMRKNGIASQLGKIPPQAIDVEEVILGALMLEKNAMNLAYEILKPDVFYKEEHKEIFTAIRTLSEKSQPIDIITVTNELRTTGKLDMIGGPLYISELTNRVGSAANFEYYARIISQKYILRKLIEISSDIQTDAYEENTDVIELLDKAEQSLFNITEENIKTTYDPMSKLVAKTIQLMQDIKNNAEGFSGVPSGFADIDRVTSGWQKSDLIIMAARPGVGKTAFVLRLARNAAIEAKKPVALFSLEMPSTQLVMRLIAAEAEIDGRKMRHGDLEDHEWAQLSAKIANLSSAPIFIDDSPSLNIYELRAKCRRLKSQHNIELVIIDYLQLMSGAKDGKQNFNREQEISSISRGLKQMAKELNVPVIALSQLSRDLEKRTSKKPVLSDLRESGSIEQDADQVMFIYRPEMHGITEDEDGNPTKGVAELIIAKNRHGQIETIKLKYVERFAKFEDLNAPESFSTFGGSFGSALTNFNNPKPGTGLVTFGSKMNADEDEASQGNQGNKFGGYDSGITPGEEAPF